jgi:hypothetical protein
LLLEYFILFFPSLEKFIGLLHCDFELRVLSEHDLLAFENLNDLGG